LQGKKPPCAVCLIRQKIFLNFILTPWLEIRIRKEGKLMKDCHGREISYLRLSLTDLCNLRCKYCMPADGIEKKAHKEILTVEEIEEIARACTLLGIRKIRLTGGEPLVRKGILDICARVGAIPGLQELCITTNGVLLSDYAAALKKAGVTRVNISLDTLRPDRYTEITRGGKLDRVLNGIAAAFSAGLLPVKVNVVLMEDMNRDEIPDFVALTQHMPLQIRFIELMPIGVSADWEKRKFIGEEVVLAAAPELIPCEETQGGVARIYRLPNSVGNIGLISPMSRHFCGRCNRIRITADGKLKPCLHSSSEINLKGLSGSALRDAIAAGIADKPLSHHMNETGASESVRAMHQIGG